MVQHHIQHAIYKILNMHKQYNDKNLVENLYCNNCYVHTLNLSSDLKADFSEQGLNFNRQSPSVRQSPEKLVLNTI